MLLLKVLKQGCRKWGGPQFLADQLTLSQPGGGTLSSPSTTSPPGFSDLVTALIGVVGRCQKVPKFDSQSQIFMSKII